MQSPDSNQPKSALFKKVGPNLYRLEPTGGYYALFKRSGKQIRRSLKTKDAVLARRRLTELRGKVGRLDQSRDASKVTFDDLSNQWLSVHRVGLKWKSISRIEVCLNGLKPSFRGVPVRNISRNHCEGWITKRGQTLSPSSYKHERRILITVLDYAVRLGLILDNPAREAVPVRKISKPNLVIPTRDQFCQLIKAMRQADIRAQHGANLVELLAYSGMRLMEALNLTWGDINWERGSFTVTGGEYGTKNGETREVPLFPAMTELLERIKGDRAPEPTDRIIPLRGGNGAATAIRTACRKANLPNFRHHTLRHHFCSNAIEAGIDFKVIASWLGHQDGGYLVAKTYGHLRQDHSFEMAKRMNFGAQLPEPSRVEAIRSQTCLAH